MGTIKLLNTIVNKNEIKYEYEYSDDVKVYFNAEYPFMIEYISNINFEEVPKSILNVPFVMNLMPLCWVFDIAIEVDELDEQFLWSLKEIKKGFCKIYPDVSFGGSLYVKLAVNNEYSASNKVTCLFSGGVDATFTFLRHEEEKPAIFNVWGVDVSFSDNTSHCEMEDYFAQFAADFGVEYTCIKSTLRTFLNEELLNKEGYKILGDYWWHGAQHSIGLLSLLAPYNFVEKVRTNYIASTFTDKEFLQGVKCVSYPVVDDCFRVGSTVACHDGYGYERIQKVQYICEKRKSLNKNIDLKVCFHYINGKNCSNCEKCFRTILAILIYDPQIEKYGFRLNDDTAKTIRRFLDDAEVGLFRWKPIQEAYIEHPVNIKIRWLATYKFNSASLLSRCKRRLKNLIRS